MKRCIHLVFWMCFLAGTLVVRMEASALLPATVDSTRAVHTDSLDLPANSTGDIDFSVDAVGFKGQDGYTFMEFYLLLRPSQFVLEEQKNKKYEASFTLGITVTDSTGTIVQSTSQPRVFHTDQPIVINRRGEERVMLDQISLSLLPGPYRANVRVYDEYGKREGTATKPFIADAYTENLLMISDLQFSTVVRQDTLLTRFVKNGLSITPNPIRIFEKRAEANSNGLYQPRTLYAYFEVYHLAESPPGEPTTFNLTYAVKNHTTGIRTALPSQKEIPKPGTETLKVYAFDYVSFPEAIYTLEVTAHDNGNGAEVTRKSVFEVVQPPAPPPPITVLTKKQADRGFKMLKFIASQRDLGLYKKLDLPGKTEFLVNFWKDRDPTPATPENEYMIVINERFSFAEYQLGGAEGDRGRIYMRYGEPEEIERVEADNQSKAYQKWYYVSGVDGDPTRREESNRDFFIFGDRLGVGKFELLHCSAKTDVYNPDWKNLLGLSTPYQRQQVQQTELKPGEE